MTFYGLPCRLRAMVLSLLLLAGVALIPLRAAHAQSVSLDSSNILEDVTVTLDGQETSVTVLRDAFNDRQWYYIPKRPRLVEKKVEGKTVPVFMLYRWQAPDPANPNQLIDSGVLQFSATFALPATVVEQIRAAIAQRRHVPASEVILTALRPKSAVVTVYAPGGESKFVNVVDGAGKAPLYATQEMPFNIELTKLGAAIYPALVSGNGGIKLQVAFVYSGLTEPAGFSVEVNYRQAHSLYSRDARFRAEASYFGYFGASYESRTSELRSKLENAGAIKVRITEGSNFRMEDVDRYLQPILKRINDQILETFRPPSEVPAQAAWNPRTGTFGGVNYTVATKSEERIRSHTETIDFSVRTYEERETAAGGFIAIGDYPEDIRRQLITVINPQFNPELHMLLPQFGDDQTAGSLRAAALRVEIMDGTNQIRKIEATWKPSYGALWEVYNPIVGANVKADYLKIPLADLRQNGHDLGALKVRSTLKLSSPYQGDIPVVIVRETPLKEAYSELIEPQSWIKSVTVDANRLSWQGIGEPETPSPNAKRVAAVELKIEHAGRTVTRTLSPRNVNGRLAPPDAFLWTVPAADLSNQPVTLRVDFHLSDGSVVTWSRSGDIRNAYLDLTIPLQDYDWAAL